MKKLRKIPADFQELDESGAIGDSEQITEDDLRQIDRQLNLRDLEIVWFENGAAINWYINDRP